LSLVSKSWAEALRGPGHAWRVISLNYSSGSEDEAEQLQKQAGISDDDLTRRTAQRAAVHAWFASRPGCAATYLAVLNCLLQQLMRAMLQCCVCLSSPIHGMRTAAAGVLRW